MLDLFNSTVELEVRSTAFIPGGSTPATRVTVLEMQVRVQLIGHL